MKRTDLSYDTRCLLDNPQPLWDAAHETADGHYDVIHPVASHTLVANATTEERVRAEEEVSECAMETSEYNTLASRIAYFIHRDRFACRVGDELAEYAESDDVSDADRAALKQILS